MLKHQQLLQRMKKCNTIKRGLADSNSKYQVITGHFYAKIGTKTKEEDFKSMRVSGIGVRNERGDRVIEHKLIIAIFFSDAKTKQSRKNNNNKINRHWTWESPGGETRNKIDFAFSNQRGIVTNCEVITDK